jgi:hypothetical protein
MYGKVLIAVLLLCVGCNKNGLDFELYGAISDKSFNNQPLSGASIELYSYPLGSTFPKLIAEHITSGSGNYKFTIPRERVVKYELKVFKEGYFSNTTTINFSELTTENANNVNVAMNAIAWVKISLKNALSPNSSDELKLLKSDFYSECSSCCQNGFSYYFGSIDTVLSCPTLPNDFVRIYHWLNETEKYGYDSLLTKPLDTVYLDITY